MLLAMVTIGVISALLIVSVYQWTLPRVQRLKAEALEKAIFKVLPGTEHSKTYGLNADGSLYVPQQGDTPDKVVYAGYDQNGALMGYAVEAAGMGYADIIRILYGYDPEQEFIIGFHVLESKETPGLGDKIEKEPRFLENFRALDVSLSGDGKIKNPVVTVKQGEKENPWEMDGITGATISSRAIGEIIGSSTAEMIPILQDHYKQEAPFAMPEEQKRNE